MALLVKFLPHFILVSQVANENSSVNLILIYMHAAFKNSFSSCGAWRIVSLSLMLCSVTVMGPVTFPLFSSVVLCGCLDSVPSCLPSGPEITAGKSSQLERLQRFVSRSGFL